MKNFKVLLLLLAFFISCQKDKDLNNNQQSITLSKSEIAKIGKEHNRIMIGTINRSLEKTSSLLLINSNAAGVKKNTLEYGTIDLYDDLNSFLISIGYPSISQLEFEHYTEIYDPSVIQSTLNDSIASIQNYETRTIMSSLLYSVINSTDYSSLTYDIAYLTQQAETNLTGIDQAAVLASLSVALNSASMWLPVSEGGQGYFEVVENRVYTALNSNDNRKEGLVSVNSTPVRIKPSYVIPMRKKIGYVIGADFSGAFFGFMRAAMPYFLSGGPINPVSNAALLGNTILGAVQGSTGAAYAFAKPH